LFGLVVNSNNNLPILDLGVADIGSVFFNENVAYKVVAMEIESSFSYKPLSRVKFFALCVELS
jgi:hypothetical protein